MTAIRLLMHRGSMLVAGFALALGACSWGPSVPPTGTASPTANAAATAQASTGLAATPAASATPQAATFSWRRIGAFPTSSQVWGVAASPTGYAVLEDPRTVWFSADGRTWKATELPFTTSRSNGIALNAHANAIAGGPSGFVAVGGYSHAPCAPSADGGPPACMVGPISWSSSDGVTWRSSQPTPIPSAGAALPAYEEIVVVWPAAGGFDAAAEARDSVLYHGNTLLHTTDGRAWTRLTPAPLPDGVTSGQDIYSHAGVATADGRRIVWQTREPSQLLTTLSTSTDGVLWNRVPTFASTGAFIDLALAPDAGATGPWLLLGRSATGERWWRSDDLVTWHSGDVAFTGIPRAGLSAITRLDGGYLSIGLEQLEDHTTIPVTLTSPDGMTWAFLDGPLPAPQDGPIFMVDGPAGLVGIGSGDSGSAAWLGVDLRR